MNTAKIAGPFKVVRLFALMIYCKIESALLHLYNNYIMSDSLYLQAYLFLFVYYCMAAINENRLSTFF